MPPARVRGDLVHGHHPHFHVLVDVAVEHPGAHAVGDPVRGDELRGQNREDVGVALIEGDYVAVPASVACDSSLGLL